MWVSDWETNITSVPTISRYRTDMTLYYCLFVGVLHAGNMEGHIMLDTNLCNHGRFIVLPK